MKDLKDCKIVFCGSVKCLAGYGARSRDLATALIELGLDVQIIAIPWGDTPQTALDLTNPKHKAIYERIISPDLHFKPDIFIHSTIPSEFQAVGEYNIGLTAGIETTICQPEWIVGCNKMDLVLVSSVHSKQVFETCQFEKREEKTNILLEILKLKTPCEVLFEGMDLDVFKKITCRSQIVNNFMKDVKEPFCFLHVGHWLQGDLGHDRKDIGMLIHTFYNTFKKKAPQNRPALILKTSHANFSNLELHSIKDKIQLIGQLVKDEGYQGELPNVYILHGELSDQEINDLYNHEKVKAMVSFTKGEGFGRPLLEFTLTGKPVIASSWSGQLDFLNPEFSYLLPGQIQQVHPSAVNNWIMAEGGWFTVNYTYASQILESCYKFYDKFLDKTKKHINITKNSFSLEAMKNTLHLILSKLDDYKETKMIEQPQLQEFKLPQRKSE